MKDTLTDSLPDEELEQIQIWTYARDICSKVIGMPKYDGICYATQVRRINSLQGMESGMLCVEPKQT